VTPLQSSYFTIPTDLHPIYENPRTLPSQESLQRQQELTRIASSFLLLPSHARTNTAESGTGFSASYAPTPSTGSAF